MTPATNPSRRGTSDSAVLIELVEGITNRLHAGEAVDIEAEAAAHPEHADELRALLPALRALADLSRSGVDRPLDDRPALGELGDFRIIREVGRGGMGIVYEAMQLSLGRRVALKVLPFAATMDPRQLQRFHNEARAAASLHHEHIVPVHGVGCERGVHYYVMQLIEGQTLTQVIRGLRGEAATVSREEAADPAQTTAVARRTDPADRGAAYSRRVAKWGIEVAEALEHAHGLGVVHRDVKPGNLMLDETGRVWVTDFGLARLGADVGVTMTGDVLGTLRYMSPEQALGQRAVIDHRTDVYSLGATLYELLALEPAFPGEDRQELLRQIAFEEPRPLRRLNPAVPAELETIVLKAMAKNPAERYAAAGELADDLRRFLEDRPIQARRPTLRQRAAKWARRHRTVVRAAGVVLGLAVLALAVSTVFIWRAKEDLEQALRREQWNGYRQRIALADREWTANNLQRMLQLLEECPADLRGWEWHYLKRLPRGELPPLRHGSALQSVAISPDGQRIASISHGGFVSIWDAQTGQKLLGFQAYDTIAQSVAFSPDGRLLATGSWRGPVKVWDAHTAQLRYELGARSGVVAFSPDGQRLASAGGQEPSINAVNVWDVTTRKLLFKRSGPGMEKVAFSPDGKRLAITGDKNIVQIWDAQTGEEQLTFRGHTRGVTCVAFSPNGRLLASGGGPELYPSEREVKVWDAQTGQELFTLQGHLGRVWSVAFSPDGRRLAWACSGTVKLWDVATGQEVLTLRGHLDTVRDVAFSRDGRRLVSASTDGTVRVWDATPVTDEWDPNCLTLPGPGGTVFRVAFHPRDERLLAACYEDGKVRVWDLSLGQPRCIRRLAVGKQRVSALAFSRQGQWLAAVADKDLKVWDATTYQEVRAIPGGAGFVCLAFSPDEKQVAAAGYGGFGVNFDVRVWDLANDKGPRRFPGNTWAVHQVAFSPDGRLLASTGQDGIVRIWDVKTGKRIDTPPLTPLCPSRALAFSPDDKQLAVGSNDQVVRIWDTATWKLLHEYRDPGWVMRVAFSPNGKRLAWGSADSTVKVWDIPEGRAGVDPRPHTLRGHTNWVLSVAFSPDGKQIASASADGTVKIWKAPPMAERAGREARDQDR